MGSNKYYQKLLKIDPLGYIDPFKDLGSYDPKCYKFKDPVSELRHPLSGRPYSKVWQKKIEEMRFLFISYIKSLDEVETLHRNIPDKDGLDRLVSNYLRLGFHFSEIEKKVEFGQGHLRNKWSKKDHIQFRQPEFFSKEDLQDGYFNPIRHYKKGKS